MKKLLFVVVIVATVALGQMRSPMPQMEKPKNLKVLPDTLDGEQVRRVMFSFSNSLGVHCNYCHVGDDSKRPPEMDFASDMMTTKRTAREMIKMVGTINANIKEMFKKSGDTPVEVACITCHRGVAKPERLEDVLWEDYHSGGVDQAKKHYNELRTQYYGGFAYDFQEATLIRFAEKCLEEKKFDDAVSIINWNAEYFPDSPRTMTTLASVYVQSNQKEKALPILEKVLKIDPNNRQAKRMIQSLGQEK